MYKYSVLSAAILPLLLASPAANADTTSFFDVTQIGKANAAYVIQLSGHNSAEIKQIGIANGAGIFQAGKSNFADVHQHGKTNRSWIQQEKIKYTDFGNQYYLFIYQKDGYNLLTYGPSLPTFSRLGRIR